MISCKKNISLFPCRHKRQVLGGSAVCAWPSALLPLASGYLLALGGCSLLPVSRENAVRWFFGKETLLVNGTGVH